MKRLAAAALCVLFALSIFGCADAGNSAKDIEITSVGWTIQNLPGDFWSDGSGKSIYIRFSLKYSGDPLTAGDIESLEISDEGTSTYTEELTDEDLLANNIINSGMYFYNSGYSNNSSLLRLGNYTYKIKLKDGRSATKTVQVTVPGYDDTKGYDYICSEDLNYVNVDPSRITLAIPRAAVKASDRNSTAVSVDFSVEHPAVYNGYLWLFDENDKYLGISHWFCNPETGAAYSHTNNGDGFYKDGETNTVEFGRTTIEWENDSSTIGDIASVRVILVDGAQYKDSDYDYRSVSSLHRIELN